MALPLTGLVSQLEPSLQGLLMQASLRWHSRPRQGWAVISRTHGRGPTVPGLQSGRTISAVLSHNPIYHPLGKAIWGLITSPSLLRSTETPFSCS